MKNDPKIGPREIKKLLLKGGKVIDPATRTDIVKDILINKDIIEDIGRIEQIKGAETIDCSELTIIPGLLDMHVHLREPGREEAETVASGCDAAMAGGFTGVCSMPNTKPVTDNRGQVEFILERARTHMVDVFPVAAVSIGLQGEHMTEMADMIEAGAVGFSDDGYPVRTSSLMRRSLEYAKQFGTPIINHCEVMDLTENRVMNEGATSTRIGLRGIPSVSEDIMVARDIMLAEYTGGPLHIAHVSTAGAVNLIRDAKKRGVKVTAETCPHYLVLTEKDVVGYNTNAKMKPPLRGEADRKALIEGVKDGTIDAIATDHAPHISDEKDCEFAAAAFGIIGLETAVGVILTKLVHEKIIDMKTLVQRMSAAPRSIINKDAIKIKGGEKANLTLIDMNKKWEVDPKKFYSKSRNTPFAGWKLKGKAVGVINDGRLFYIG